jgi:DNA-binding CsgD family transcriptional regulator
MTNQLSANYFESLFYNLPGLVFAKDTNLNYIGMNKNFLDMLQKSDDKILGKDDYDLPWQKYATLYREQDKYILEKRKSCQFIEPLMLSNDQEYISIVQKFIHMDRQGTVIGTIGKIINIKPAKAILGILKLWLPTKITLNEKLNTYIICDDLYAKFGLSKRESESLFHLIHGKTIREIGEILGISQRTAEKYIVTLKEKLYCRSKSDLINKSIDLGLINLIPSHYMALVQPAETAQFPFNF